MKKILLCALVVSAFAAAITFTDLTPDSNDSAVILQQKTVQAILENTIAVTNSSSGSGGMDTSAIDTASEFFAIMTDFTGSGNAVRATAPTISSPTVNGLTTKSGQTSYALLAPTGTGTTNLIVNFTNGVIYVETLGFTTTWITFTNIPSGAAIEMSCVLRLTGNGSRSIQILNSDFQFATAISTNALASGETEFTVTWTGAEKVLRQDPHPYLDGLTGNVQTQLDSKLSVVATASSVTVNDDAYDATSWNGSTNVPTKNAIRDKIESLSGSYVYTIPIGTPVAANITATTYYLGNQSGLNSVQGRYVMAVPITGHVIGYAIHFRTGTTTTAPTGNTLDLWLNNAQVPGGQYSLTWVASTVIAVFQACTSTAVSANDLLEVRTIFGGSPSAASLSAVQFNVMIQVP